MNESRKASDETRGHLLAKFAPQGVGLRLSLAPVNTSWPFPRSFEIYEHGLYVMALGTSAWIERGAIKSLRFGVGYVRVKWELGGGIRSATVSSMLRIGRIKRALQDAGFSATR